MCAAVLVSCEFSEALMPLYEYACQDCGHRFEVRQSIRDEPLTTCPRCGGSIRRVVQPVGIVFKGSGFYKTDSRSSSASGAATGERKSESGASGQSSAPASTGAADTSSSTPAPGASAGDTKAAAS